MLICLLFTFSLTVVILNERNELADATVEC